MEEFMTKNDILCPECESKNISITGNISPDEYFCECDDCRYKFEVWVVSESFY